MSVIVKDIPGCRHGNQFCQYIVGRILSEGLRFKLFGIQPDHPEFCLGDIELNYNQENYAYNETPIQLIGNRNYNDVQPDFNIEDIINDKTPRRIILDGYFQRKKFFIPYKEDIKKWYGYKKYDILSTAAVAHVRLGDLRATNHPDLLPLSYYDEALEMIKFDQLSICTDSPNDSYIQHLKDKYNASIFLDNEKNTICFMASHNNIVQSVGTFSFWAGFFSDAENIINAIPRAGNNRISPDNGVDLLIRTPNYKYITL